jgi:hypothetical protein
VLLLFYEGAIGAPASADESNDSLSLDRIMNDLSTKCTQATDALAKSASTLGAVYRTVFPTGAMPSTADGFADVLGPGTTTMADFARTLAVRGSTSTLKLLLGHGIECDYEAALSDFPRKPDGKPLSLKGVSGAAERLAEVFMTTMERRAVETAARLLKSKSGSSA